MGLYSDIAVKSGFWKGITEDDLNIFQHNDKRYAQLPLHVDYTRYWGADFVRAQKDIRLFPAWAQGPQLSPRNQLADVEESIEYSGLDSEDESSVD